MSFKSDFRTVDSMRNVSLYDGLLYGGRLYMHAMRFTDFEYSFTFVISLVISETRPDGPLHNGRCHRFIIFAF